MNAARDDIRLDALYGRVSRRLLPFLFLCYVAAYLDRVNVGFAKLQMQADLALSDTVYGIGAGIFFIGYFVFEVPSNLVLEKVGARRWIARIMISWGLVSAATMFATGPVSFYVLRFLLGVAEAGFFPGVVLYLTYWYPAHRRARIVALFMSGVAVAGVLGGPLSGAIMAAFAGKAGLHGWQWLFLLEGIPSVVLGIWTLFYLDDGIRSARWLDDADKAALERELAAEAVSKQHLPLRQVFASGTVWLLALVYFLFVMGLYGVSFWLPQLLKNSGVQDVFHIGLLTAIPYGVAAVVMVLAARHSDRSGERRWHAAIAGFAGAAGLVAATVWAGDTVLALAALSVATAGILTTFPIFWSLPTALLGGTAAAAGIALINSVGNLAGFASPYLVGAIRDATGSTAIGISLLAASQVLGGLLVLARGQSPGRQEPPKRA
ncbi:MFS transporter [Pseudoduganella umbonata]|uniref:D-galactonate transporter n=1 Tax=Pseudoduganella umbonata TaxID=864828 RepID=A0A4V1EDV2_9BURK|nr:MFS transporter [Pseudoduganella umbonata]MBB3222135.1 D-galactonate transporter [Pseudoduganella umbonata]QCP12371.1 MFS transporter [Pseudoduganella umbonata]